MKALKGKSYIQYRKEIQNIIGYSMREYLCNPNIALQEEDINNEN